MYSKKTTIISILCLLILLTIVAALLPSTLSTVDPIQLTKWVEELPFEPVILQPEPENIPLRSGPLYIKWLNYVEMSYINVGEPDRTGTIHNFFQSGSFAPFFEESDLLKSYRAEREDVVTRHYVLQLDNRDVSVEVRRNKQKLDSGLSLFKLGTTSVAHNWYGTTEQEALAFLERHIQLVTKDDVKLIEQFDQRLQERWTRVSVDLQQ